MFQKYRARSSPAPHSGAKVSAPSTRAILADLSFGFANDAMSISYVHRSNSRTNREGKVRDRYDQYDDFPYDLETVARISVLRTIRARFARRSEPSAYCSSTFLRCGADACGRLYGGVTAKSTTSPEGIES